MQIQMPRRLALFAFVFVGIFTFSLFALPTQVSAGDDYPWKSYGNGAIDPLRFGAKTCTSYVGWRMNRDHGTTAEPWWFKNAMNGGWFGNANNWDNNAAALGFAVNSTPQVGSIALWEAGSGGAGAVGHVAYVEKVNVDGSVAISEYNWGNKPYAYRDDRKNVRADKYIHINTAQPPKLTSPASGTTIYSHKFTLKWSSVAGATGYEVSAGDKTFTSSSTSIVLERGDVLERQHLDWKVRAVYSGGSKGPWSSVWKFFYLPTGDVASAASLTRLVQSKVNLDNTLSTRYLNAATGVWSTWQINNALKFTGTPTLAFFKDNFYQAVRAEGGAYHLRTSKNGKDWGAFVSMAGSGRSDVSMAVFDNKLFQSVKTTADTVSTRYTKDGITWTPWVNTSFEIAGNPTMAVFGTKLVQVVYKKDGYLYARYTTNGKIWTNFVKMGSSRTLRDVALAQFNGKLYISITGAASSKLFLASTTNAVTWSAFAQTEVVVKGSPTLAVLGGKLIQSARRSDNDHVVVRFTKDGVIWKEFYENGATLSTPSMFVFNGTVYQAMIGNTGVSWWMRSSGNAKEWSEWLKI